jgi:hypothetical protein
MFKINDKVKVVKDIHGEWFIGCEGVIEALDKEDLYGLRIYKSNKLFTEAHMEIGDSILYFRKEELELI